MAAPLTSVQIATALRQQGLEPGDTVFVHSALSSLSTVDGGAETVVEAFARALGPQGTLAAPTFTFSLEGDSPLFDGHNQPSEMGRISEVVRTWPGARRSTHLHHSIAAFGKNAAALTAVHGPSAWAADGPFWQLVTLDAKIMLLGVPYLRCTFFHVLEQLVQVPYRHWVSVRARLAQAQANPVPLPTQVFAPKPNFGGNDFNKFGIFLEKKNNVRKGAIGNAVTRVFKARIALEIGLAQYRHDPELFLKTTPEYTPLFDGALSGRLYNEKWVLDPGRIHTSQT